MIIKSYRETHSAAVKLTMMVENRCLDVAQVTPNTLFLRVPTELPPCDAVLSVCIDGNTTEQRLRLPDGASVDSPSVRVERIE